jgi:hypothetical protein
VTASAADHEDSLSLFLLPRYRSRFAQLLGSRRGREKLRRSLAHFDQLDRRFLVPVGHLGAAADAIERLLRSRGAPAICHVVSEDPSLDGRDLPLPEALVRIVGRGMGALVSCVPGRLGFFEGEEPGDRWLLERRDL